MRLHPLNLVLFALLLIPCISYAIPLPSAEDIARYRAEGRWPQVQSYIEWLHGAVESRLSDADIVQLVEDGYGLPTARRGGAQSPPVVDDTASGGRQGGPPTGSPRANLDGNDVVDERDILALGYRSAATAGSATRNTSVTLPYGTAAQGNQPKCLVLLIKFPDQEPTDLKNQGADSDVNHDAAWAAEKWFELDAPGGGNLENASVAHYFKTVSYGKLELAGDVFDNASVCDGDGWITSAYDYDDVRTGVSSYSAVIDDAISQIDPHVDFNDYDSNNDGYVDGLITIYAGADDPGAGGYAWYFRWLSDPGANTADDVRIAQGVWVSEQGYLYHFCHEFGHELGLPDLYDVGGSNSGPQQPGGGMWTLMSDWNTGTGKIPPLPDAWCRTRLRFVEPVDVLTTGDVGVTCNCASTASSPADTVFRIWRNGVRGPEYFLFEYRDATAGFDQNLPGSGGLMLWHADEGQTTGNNRDNDFDPMRITFEPADNAVQTWNADGDPWRSGYNGGDSVDYFDDGTTPNAKDNTGTATGVRIEPTDSPGGATMSATVHNAGSGLPSLSFDAPDAGASVSGSVTVDVSSDATQRVEYYVNGCLKYVEDGPSPYNGFTWDTLTALNGDAVLRAVAFNSGAEVQRIVERSVTVSNAQASGYGLDFSDNFNGYSGADDSDLLAKWNLHGDGFGLTIQHLTIDGGESASLAFAQSDFPAPPLDGNEQDTAAGTYEGQDDEWLMSPRIDLAGHSDLELSYKVAFRGVWSGDIILQTQLSADDGATWDDLEGLTWIYSGPLNDAHDTGLWDSTGAPFTYFANRLVDLDAYLGEQVYIRFLYVGGGGYNTGFALDDFALTGTPIALDSASPARAKVGDSITLAGSGFGSAQGGGEVRFADGSGGYVAQATVTSWSDTQVVCNVPSGAKSHASAGVWVHTDAGADSNAVAFKVILPPPTLVGVDQH